MGYEMTRPAQKWIGVGSIITTFLLIIFILAVPYVNHFGTESGKYTYFTRWNGKWREGQQTVYNPASELFNFPTAAPVFIGIGLLISLVGAGYLFWLTYSNKGCYFLKEKPGPIGGIVMVFGALIYFIGSFIYEKWAFGSPRPDNGWPTDNNFAATTVRISPTFWIGILLGFLIIFFATMNLVYYFDTASKRPVK